MAPEAEPLAEADQKGKEDMPTQGDETAPTQKSEEEAALIDKGNGGADVELAKPGGAAPEDKFSMVRLIMLLHGVGMLIPWSSFLTIAGSYYVCFKLRDTVGGVSVETHYSSYFFNYLTAFSQAPNLLLNFTNLFVTFKGGLALRVLVSICLVGILCVFTMILVFVDSSSWIGAFFALTMITVVLLNGANGVYQNSMFGIASDLPPDMIAMIVTGNNLCAVITALCGIGAVAAATSPQASATFFFACSLLIVIACGVSFVFVQGLPFYTHYVKDSIRKSKKDEVAEESGPKETARMKLDIYVDVFKTAWRQLLDVWLVFFVCLSIYPSVEVEFDRHPDFFISPKFFALVTTFLNFGVFAFLGSLLTNYVQWPSSPYLIIITGLRLLLIPFFLACNVFPNTRRWGVLIYDEWVFIIAGAIQGFTTGYCAGLAMMYAPGAVEPKKARYAGMLAGFTLVVGLCCGIIFTFVERWFMEGVGPKEPVGMILNATSFCG